MAERHSEYARDADDHYVDPSWCTDRLLDRYPDVTALHDPCCGFGTIPIAAMARGLTATGADLRDRANGRWPVMNFFSDQHQRPNILTNPPFRIAVPIIEHALSVVEPGGIVAAICQAKFLFSQRRHPLFTRPEMERVIILSTRPSMPTGALLAEKGEACRGGGSIDFLWCIWRAGQTMPRAPTSEWVL